MISYPDVAENTNMYTDLTQEFLRNGHDVYVAAPSNKVTKICTEGGISVLRVRSLPLFNTSTFKKGIANVLLPMQYKRAIRKFLSTICFDLVVIPTPPITFVGVGRFLKNSCNAKIYLILRDIFPQNAKDLGMIKNNFIFSYFRHQEKKMYELADHIGCMSNKNIDFVYSNNPEIDYNKLHLLPNWISVTDSVNSGVDFRSKFNLKNKFLAVFGGNFGIPQKIEFLINVADRIRDYSDIIFLLVGSGTEKGKIENLIYEKKLDNVIIINSLPREEYMSLLNECNIGLVNLSDKFTIPNIPSRTLSYWSRKLPVLAAVDKNTDFGEILDKCKGGLWSVTGDTESYIFNLLLIYNNSDMARQMGLNGYTHLINELNTQIAYKTLISRFN
jgi:hypothetical protein